MQDILDMMFLQFIKRQLRLILVCSFLAILICFKFSDNSSFNKQATKIISQVGLQYERFIHHIQTKEKITNNNNFPKNLFYEDTFILNKSCFQLPNYNDVKFNNSYWQVFNSLFLFSSYFDSRSKKENKQFIRINAINSGPFPKYKIFCQIWFTKPSYVAISQVSDIRVYQNYFDGQYPKGYMLSCEIPKNKVGIVPVAVSIVDQPCVIATNLLTVGNNVPDRGKKKIAVCAKGYYFPDTDHGKYITEWIEIHSILGIEKITIYSFALHPNTTNVFKYYMSKGIVEVIPITLPGKYISLLDHRNNYQSQPKPNKLELDLLTYNDCFYRNMNLFDFITLVDIDEVTIPSRHNSWRELFDYLKLAEKENNIIPTHYLVRYAISLNSMKTINASALNIPSYMHMPLHVIRSRPYQYSKPIINTTEAIIAYTHYPTLCFSKCIGKEVSQDIAILWHYRFECGGYNYSCNKNNSIRDTSIYRFKDELIARTSKTLKALNLIP